MIKSSTRVSVIIPTYKREVKYLLRAINSVKNQTYKNTEIIVVDDNPPGSEYRKRMMDFMKQYTNDSDVIYYVNETNMGGALARNNGINVATGDFITFLDDDDEYLTKKVEKQLNFMIEKNCDMSFTDLKLVNDNKVVIDYREYPKLNSFDKQGLLKYHIMRHLTGTPTFMYKASKLKEIGGFEDVKMGQEFYLMLKSIENDLKICYFPECDVRAYRHNKGGISQGKNKIIGENELFEFKKKYFNIFTTREKMFIRFRHYAVMTMAYKRNKQYFRALKNVVIMFVSSPIDCIIEGRCFILRTLPKRERKK
ncbi:glycosyltransferase family 2 protein [Serpentinicella sp. ANB-PHB4]|uniref:glycosyltransferase family 2 protein n=1 Tax=Serpentinicella sp. ANB-PHB4 TaxID=3074076 RepID=UPI002862A2BF|nr:glycosyltransferase family 2 protein [Serpentinicella sp. ANB-PHB4]MDR5658767.1 glycosyltransferase family 2 protein [Serpentinicella sp. ANB-PHB4]